MCVNECESKSMGECGRIETRESSENSSHGRSKVELKVRIASKNWWGVPITKSGSGV